MQSAYVKLDVCDCAKCRFQTKKLKLRLNWEDIEVQCVTIYAGVVWQSIAHRRCLRAAIKWAIGRSMSTLTKRDIVLRVSEKAGAPQALVADVVQGVLAEITDSLARGETVELRNFGVLKAQLTKARVGRNPNEPEKSVPIPPRATVKFKAGKEMRERVLKLTSSLKRGGKDAAPAKAAPVKKAAKPAKKK
jgi:nucleoid DNA-binding protein